jgi:hypothetical protein
MFRLARTAGSRFGRKHRDCRIRDGFGLGGYRFGVSWCGITNKVLDTHVVFQDLGLPQFLLKHVSVTFMTYFRRGFSRTPSDVFCLPAAPLSHDSAGGGGQIALLDWFRKRTRSTPSGDDEVKLRAKTPQTVRKLQTSWPVSRDSYSFGQVDRAGHMTPLDNRR